MSSERPLRIAIFNLEPAVRESIFSLFSRHTYQLTVIDQVADLSDPERISDGVDAVVVPLATASGRNGVALALQLKAEREFQSVPVVGVVYSTERRMAEALYDSGADTVFVLPGDTDLLYLQIRSLVRSRQFYRELLAGTALARGSRDLLAPLLQALPFGLLLLDHAKNVVFLNHRFSVLLELSLLHAADSTNGELPIPSSLLSEISPVLNEAEATGGLYSEEHHLTTASGISTPLRVSAIPVALPPSSTIPLATDDTQYNRCTMILLQRGGHRAVAELFSSEMDRAVSLLFLYYGAARQLALEQHKSLFPGKALASAALWTASESHVSMLSAVFPPIIELLDLLFPASATVRIRGSTDLQIAARRSHLMELLGLSLFSLARQLGFLSRIDIEVSVDPQAPFVIVRAEAHPAPRSDLEFDDTIGEALRLLAPPQPSDAEGVSWSSEGGAVGYARIEEILIKIGAEMNFSFSEGPEGSTLRLVLPMAQRT